MDCGNLNNLGSTCVPHTIYQILGHRSVGSEVKDILRFLTYSGMAAMLIT